MELKLRGSRNLLVNFAKLHHYVVIRSSLSVFANPGYRVQHWERKPRCIYSALILFLGQGTMKYLCYLKFMALILVLVNTASLILIGLSWVFKPSQTC